MYLVMIFIFYFILISVLYIYLYTYLYPYIYSNFIIFITMYYIIINFINLNYIIHVNIYITFSDRIFGYFWISKSINPRLSVFREPSISNRFYKISDWFSRITDKEKSL